MKKKILWKIIPPLSASVAFLVMSALYCLDLKTPYRAILNAWGIDPFSFPFLDTDTVLSAVRCMNKGVDVYVSNPCDVLGRVYDYSPLWMALTVFPMTVAWRVPIGLGVDIAYIFSLLLLPVARDMRGAILIAAGALSSASVFAVERGNNDLVLFVLVAGAATLLCRSPVLRAVGYGAAVLAGLLKYYPMALMLMAMRERMKAMLAIGLFASLAVVLFAVLTWHDLTRALGLIPTGSYFGNMFGAVNAGGGLAELLGLPPLVATIIREMMTACAFAIGLVLGCQKSSRETILLLHDNERSFLLAGSIMLAGCFFTAQNIDYRAVHILLVLPALAVLFFNSPLRHFRYAMPVAIGLLWSQTWQNALHQLAIYSVDERAGSIIIVATWAVREEMWWFLMTILVSCIVTLVVEGTSATSHAGSL